MKLINDIISILTSLSFVDYILYFSVLALLILTIALIYVLKSEEQERSLGSEEMKENDNENEIDLEYIANNIKEKPEPLVDMTAYEEEQEQKAIISYEQLVKESNKKQLLYDKVELVDNLIPTKKINLSDMSKEKEEEIPETTTFHYEREEAFLKTLKELNSLLN